VSCLPRLPARRRLAIPDTRQRTLASHWMVPPAIRPPRRRGLRPLQAHPARPDTDRMRGFYRARRRSEFPFRYQNG
jgi:hypothetical protein